MPKAPTPKGKAAGCRLLRPGTGMRMGSLSGTPGEKKIVGGTGLVKMERCLLEFKLSMGNDII